MSVSLYDKFEADFLDTNPEILDEESNPEGTVEEKEDDLDGDDQELGKVIFIDDDLDEDGEIKRAVRIPAETVVCDSIPEPTDHSKYIANFFNMVNIYFYIGDLLFFLQEKGLEGVRQEVTNLVNKWLVIQEKFLENEIWLSLSFLGCSKLAVSSEGRIYNMNTRRLFGGHHIHITFDNCIRRMVYLHSLVNAAFWKFPKEPHLTTDHRNGNHSDNNRFNLSYENAHVQALNVIKNELGYNSRPVLRIGEDKITTTRWESSRKASEVTGLKIHNITRACNSKAFYKGYYWKYDDTAVLEDEIFRSLASIGLGNYEISNHARLRRISTGRISIGNLHKSGCRVSRFRNSVTEPIRSYYYTYWLL